MTGVKISRVVLLMTITTMITTIITMYKFACFSCWQSEVVFTAHKRSLRRLGFNTCLSVILFTQGGVFASVQMGFTPPTPEEDTPLGSRHPGSRHPPAQCMLGDTGNKWAVRILLECILVCLLIWKFGGHYSFFVGPLIPLFWTSDDVYPEFQSQCGSLACVQVLKMNGKEEKKANLQWKRRIVW